MAEGAQGASCEAERLEWIWSANSKSNEELHLGEYEIHIRSTQQEHRVLNIFS